MGQPTETAVIEVKGVHWASSKAVAESVLGRRPGVSRVEANPVAQTATVTFGPEQTSIADLARWVRDCGYHCAGRSVPEHICDPMAEAYAAAPTEAAAAPAPPATPITQPMRITQSTPIT
ncbi:heavy-metal-associated domain-containing protein [Cryobacterium sp. TMT1-2-1]|uniref:cation transporter n=1 Tax=Cryobacterium sp. TMT1-2-1 TaxID=1259232 RepID=UPI001F5437BD|nr:heavy-metal-associated domain-containing protein [Cryobacterium sp. TMT1-2-1]